MSDTLKSEDIRDTNAHNYDDNSVEPPAVYLLVNTLDAEVTVTAYGTRAEDDSFDEAIQLHQYTLSAGDTNTQSEAENLDRDPWEQLRFEVVASSSPSTGSFTIYEMPVR